ncbi:type II secretion system F family protein [Nitriliruptoraceae bacterium ZYF776]|nr:type II secretion system F family protein [Profundirhabdus halotolerans]
MVGRSAAAAARTGPRVRRPRGTGAGRRGGRRARVRDAHHLDVADPGPRAGGPGPAVNGLLLVSGLALFVGLTLLFGQVRAWSRRPLTDRLAPYTPGGDEVPQRAGWWSVASLRDAVAPLAQDLVGAVSRAVGVTEDLDRRLARVHASSDATSFRVRQLGWGAGATAVALLLVLLVRPPAIIGVAAPPLSGLLAILALEQQLLSANDRWRRALVLELPVVVEQLGMRLGAGTSLTVALDRVATRGRGAVARDLTRVVARVRQGLAVDRALGEWAELAGVDAVTRVVGVLRLERDGADLGRLLAAEARTLRHEQHRDLVQQVEQRGQQVWIPVTVAALVPGIVLLAIPFASAVRGLFG